MCERLLPAVLVQAADGAPQDDLDNVEAERASAMFMLRLHGRREVTRWHRLVFFALNPSPNQPSLDDSPELTEADKQFLDFVAEQAVLELTANR
jgi:hypothetical protein